MIAAALFAACLATSHRAAAITFEYRTCSSGTTAPFDVYTNLNNRWQKNQPYNYPTHLPLNDNINVYSQIFAGPNVTSIDLVPTSFDLDVGGDYIGFNSPNGGGLAFTGSGVTGKTGTLLNNGGFASGSQSMWVYLDGTVPSQEFTYGHATLACNALGPTDPDQALPPYFDSKVFLLGGSGDPVATQHGDTVYLKTSGSPAAGYSPAYSGATGDISLTMYSGNTDNADVDIYARCGARPTPTSFDFVGWNAGTASEHLYLPVSACPSHDWRLAVQQYSGSATSVNVTWNWSSRTTDVACSAQEVSATALGAMGVTLAQAQREFYGVTQGAIEINDVELYNKNNCPSYYGAEINVVFDSSCSRSTTYTSGSPPLLWQSTICSDCTTNPQCIAHERSHGLAGQRDEYVDIPGSVSQCGHTIMGAYFMWNVDWCVSSSATHTPHDHGTDFDYRTSSMAGWSGWETASGFPTATTRYVNPNAWVAGLTPDGWTYAALPSNAFTLNVYP